MFKIDKNNRIKRRIRTLRRNKNKYRDSPGTRDLVTFSIIIIIINPHQFVVICISLHES